MKKNGFLLSAKEPMSFDCRSLIGVSRLDKVSVAGTLRMERREG